MYRSLQLLCLLFISTTCLWGSEAIELIDVKDPAKGWDFYDGREFPGAKGSLQADLDVPAQRKPALRLDADFSGGGNYVQMACDLPKVDIDNISFWVKAEKDQDTMTVRLIDAKGRCHQINFKIQTGGEWQRVVFPVARYFDKAGTSASVENVKKYESWGGEKSDGGWNNPGKKLCILTGRHRVGADKKGSLWISGAKIQPKIPDAPKKVVNKEVRLDDFLKMGEVAWSFVDGREFPGAKGSLTAVNIGTAEKEEFALQLAGDFTGGGAYVACNRDLDMQDIKQIKLDVKTDNTTSFNVRLIDSTNQCHQAKGFKLQADGAWHELIIDPRKVAGGEHWGGKNDGKWHGPAKALSILVGKGSAQDKKPTFLMKNIRAIARVEAAIEVDPYAEDFDKSASLPNKWNVEGPQAAVSVISEGAFNGQHAVRVQRSEDQLNQNVKVQGAIFPAIPGLWDIGGATRSDLYSPDNSFAMRVHIEALGSRGQVLESKTVVDQFKKKNWKPFKKQVVFPKGTRGARFTATVHKTHGWMEIDALTAAPIITKQAEEIVNRIVIKASDENISGNLFYPDSTLSMNVDVQAEKPLPSSAQTVRYVIRDYWGAEQCEWKSANLKRNGVVKRRFSYLAQVEIPTELIEQGKYYEIHAEMNIDGFAPHSEYSAFARLPEAASRSYEPLEIPFTIRSWDGRIHDYHVLASRLGIRQIGLWGGFDRHNPEKVWLPGVDTIEKQGNMWLAGVGGSYIERHGWKDVDPEKYKQGITNFLKAYSKRGLAYVVLGNEPNENHAKIKEKIRGYKLCYEAVKAFDPNITVIATSVPALDAFFDEGFGKYCDAFDFHVYETYEGVRNGVRRYKKMMEKHNMDKPIFCTELGLNSQGQTRYAVAKEVVKKITAFFAEGGVSVSWFGIQYPDPDGKSRGSSGSAHNVFDCQYNAYNPKLDAIMYYVMVNNVLDKKIVDEIQHSDGIEEYLYQNKQGDSFHVLWYQAGRHDRGVQVATQGPVKIIRIDGSSETMTPDNGVITVAVSSEPVLLVYKGSKSQLATSFSPAAISVADEHISILKGQSCEIPVTGKGLKAEQVQLQLPPFWQATVKQAAVDQVICTVTAPAETHVRSGRVIVQYKKNGNIHGEIPLLLTIKSPISVEVYAVAKNEAGEPGVRAVVTNNASEAKKINWTYEIVAQVPMQTGSFRLSQTEDVSAYLKGQNEGQMTLESNAQTELVVRMADSVAQTIYRVRITVIDELGRKGIHERYVSGFAASIKTAQPLNIDGKLDEAVWENAPIEHINLTRQFLPMGKRPVEEVYSGLEDLAVEWRSAWDNEFYYLAVEVTDDVHRVTHKDGQIWNQDGLQFLFDPMRIHNEKAGKYDYSLGKGTAGEQAWCHLTAHPEVREGEVTSFKIAVVERPGSAGGRIYEIAIPWSRLRPFKPAVGQNLGMSMIHNEDDGDGRVGFMGWFSGVHSKQLDLAGDVVLVE